jgi:small subunit ribosomal protein S16
MLKIKLSRVGRKNQPAYRIVVNERRDKRDGKYVAQVGYYDPVTKELTFKVEDYQAWMGKGALPTPTVASLYNRFTSSSNSGKTVEK